MKKYDYTSERLPEDSTMDQRFEKFLKILQILNESGIHMEEAVPNPVLVDPECGFKMTHNRMTWEVYSCKDVAEMIIEARNRFKDSLNNN